MSTFNRAYLAGLKTNIKRTQNPDKANVHAVNVLNHLREKGAVIKLEPKDAYTWSLTVGSLTVEGNNLWGAVYNYLLETLS